MKTLITGGSGFIGTHVVARLLAAGHDVLNLSLQAPHDPSHAPHWRKGDILDADALRAAIERNHLVGDVANIAVAAEVSC